MKKTREQELKEGCGKRIITPDMTSSCGDISFANKILLCPECKLELKGRQEKEKEVLGIVDGFDFEAAIRTAIEVSQGEYYKFKEREAKELEKFFKKDLKQKIKGM